MTNSKTTKLLALLFSIASLNALQAATITHSNTIQITSSHDLQSVISLGANANYTDPGSATLPMFDPALGTLNKATLTVKTNAPSFAGDVSYGPLGSPLNLLTTDSQQVSFGLSNNGDITGAGSMGGISNQLVNLPIVPLGQGGSTQINANPSTIDSTTVVTDQAGLDSFTGVGTFDVNAGVASQMETAAAILPVTLTNDGDYEIVTSITYEFTPAAGDEVLRNISTRLNVGTGDNVGIGGFIIRGTGLKTVMIRGIGPSLSSAGIPPNHVLADPVLELHNELGVIVLTNNDWRQSQELLIQATGLAPSNDLESAILIPLLPGAYTAILRGNNDGIGVGLVEVYDLDPNPSSSLQLANVSSRGQVGTGDDVLIGGFILGGDTSADVVVRAIGPSLQQSGVTGVLDNPELEVHDGNGNLMQSNANWKDSQQIDLQATGLAPADDREAAAFMTLLSGPYTIIVRGSNNSTGVALVEAYAIRN